MKIGPEFLLNTSTDGFQTDSVVSALPGGGFVAVWQDSFQGSTDDPGQAIRAQLFNADGSKSGIEFLVNTTTTGFQSKPDVVTLSDGRFVVVWTDESASADDPSSSAVRGQIFNADGSASGGEFLVNTTTTGAQFDARITALPDGQFVVVWTDGSLSSDDPATLAVRGQVFNSDSTKSGSEFLINTITAGDQVESAIAVLNDGRFVVTWTDNSTSSDDATGAAVRGQIFETDGSTSGSEFLVNTTTASDQSQSAVAGLANGGFVAVWTDSSESSDDPSGNAVRGQVFSADGSKSGAEFLVNTSTNNDQEDPAVLALSDGRFVVVWTEAEPDVVPSGQVYGQIFNTDGSKSGDQFLVNSDTGSAQFNADIDELADGNFVVVWRDQEQLADEGPLDGLGGLSGQIFTVDDGADPAINLIRIIEATQDGDGPIVETGVTFTIENISATDDGDVDALTVTDLEDDVFGDILSLVETALGGGPIVIPEGGSVSVTIPVADLPAPIAPANALVRGVDEEATEAVGGFNDSNETGEFGDGLLNITNVLQSVTNENVTTLDTVARTVAQVLSLPDGCVVTLILNDDGSTSVSLDLGEEVLSDEAGSTLGDLLAGTFPGIDAPAIVVDPDVLPDASGEIGGNTVRRDDGETVETSEPVTSFSQTPGSVFVGDLDAPNDIVVVFGQLNVATTTTETTTQNFTDIPYTDNVIVEDASVDEALAILNDTGLTDIIAALEDKLEPDGADPTINIIKLFDDANDTYTYTIENTSPTDDGDVDALTVTSLIDAQFDDILSEAVAANGGSPVVIAEGDSFTFSITRSVPQEALGVTVEGTDEEGAVATDTFSDGLIIQEVLVQETVENVTTLDPPVARTVAQVLTLPDGCVVTLILNDDGSTSVSLDLGEEVLSDAAGSTLGDLLAGTFPGVDAPAIVVDPETLPDASGEVGSGTVRRDDGETIAADSQIQLDQSPGSLIVGDADDPFNIEVIQGQLTVTITTTETTTQFFTDIPYTDNVVVEDVSVEDAIALLSGSGLTEITAALEDKLEPGGADPAINLIRIIEATQDGDGPIVETGVTFTIENISATDDGDVDALTVTELTDDVFGDILGLAEAALGGGPIVIPEGGSVSVTIPVADLPAPISTGNAVVRGTDEEAVEAVGAFNDTGDGVPGGGVNNLVQLDRTLTEEDVTEAAATRIVAQVLRLPDDCGDIFLILNADGTTSVEAVLTDSTLTAEAAAILGALDAGDLPDGAVSPDLPNDLDLANASDDDVVGTNEQRIDNGSTSETETSISINEEPGTLFIGDPENNPLNVSVIIGELAITLIETTTTTQSFTDLTVTDQVEVQEVSVEEAIAVLNGTGLTDIVAALEDKLETDLPTLSITADQPDGLDEGDDGSTDFTFTVTREGDTSDESTVDYAVTAGATNPVDEADFGGAFPSGSITFAADQTSQTITVPVLGDTTSEANEQFVVTLSNPSGATVVNATANGIVLNDDQGGDGVLNITTINNEVTVEDVTDASVIRTVAQVLRLPDGCVINLVLNADGSTSVEAVLTDSTLSADSATVLGALDAGILPIGAVTPDLPANLDLANAEDDDVVGINEQRINDGETAVTDTIVDVNASPDAVIIGDPVNAPLDVVVVTGQLDIVITNTTTTTQFFTDLTVTDQVEVQEVSVEEAIAVLNGAGLTDIIAALEEKLETELPTVSISADQPDGQDEGDAGFTDFTFTVTRDGDTSTESSVDYAVTAGPSNPVDETDFGGLFPSGTITFAAGEASQTVSVAVQGDTTPEADEQFAVTLANPDGATIEGATAIGSVLNDDGGVLNIEEIDEQVTVEDVTEASVVRTVAQVLRLPDGCVLNFILNADGSTSVEAILTDGTLSGQTAAALGALDAGILPVGAVTPDLPTNLDLENASDDDIVGTDEQRIDNGETSVTDTNVLVTEQPGTSFIGDPENDPFNVVVLIGQLDITITNTTTMTQFFTDLTVTDQVEVQAVSVEEALTLLDGAGLAEITEAFEAKLEPGNLPPVAVDDLFATDEASAVNGNVLDDNDNGPDSDPDNDTLTVVDVNDDLFNVGQTIALASGALLTLNADGSFAYDPNGAFDGLDDGETATDSFNYTIDDGNGATDTATATVTIDGISDEALPAISLVKTAMLVEADDDDHDGGHGGWGHGDGYGGWGHDWSSHGAWSGWCPDWSHDWSHGGWWHGKHGKDKGDNGQVIQYTLEVQNVNLDDPELSLISLLDDNATPGDTSDDFDVLLRDGAFIGGDTDGDGMLDVGETWTFQYTSEIDGRSGTLTNTAVASAADTDGNLATTSASASIAIEGEMPTEVHKARWGKQTHTGDDDVRDTFELNADHYGVDKIKGFSLADQDTLDFKGWKLALADVEDGTLAYKAHANGNLTIWTSSWWGGKLKKVATLKDMLDDNADELALQGLNVDTGWLDEEEAKEMHDLIVTDTSDIWA